MKRTHLSCTVADCGKPHVAHGLCALHYQRAKRGKPLEYEVRYERGLDLAERIMRYVVEDPATGCWIWQGARSSDGYGCMRIGDSTRGAHRVAYEVMRGPVPDGLMLDHLCDNPPCVRPTHLEPVTNGENVRRGYERRAVN